MDTITAARQLGRALQADENYIQMMAAQQRNEEDSELQDMIAQFNRMRMELNGMLQNENKDQDKISALDGEIKAVYNQIYQNESMAAYTLARGKVEHMMEYVNQIINGSTQGLDPDTIEFQESCGGNCGGCSGCS